MGILRVLEPLINYCACLYGVKNRLKVLIYY